MRMCIGGNSPISLQDGHPLARSLVTIARPRPLPGCRGDVGGLPIRGALASLQLPALTRFELRRAGAIHLLTRPCAGRIRESRWIIGLPHPSYRDGRMALARLSARYAWNMGASCGMVWRRGIVMPLPRRTFGTCVQGVTFGLALVQCGLDLRTHTGFCVQTFMKATGVIRQPRRWMSMGFKRLRTVSRAHAMVDCHCLLTPATRVAVCPLRACTGRYRLLTQAHGVLGYALHHHFHVRPLSLAP